MAVERDGKMRLAIRVFIDGVKQSEERIEVGETDDFLPKLAEKHAAMMAEKPGMVEIEFLDELNPEVRFFRMGTDKRSMVDPITVDLSRPAEDFLWKWGGSKRGRRA